VRIRSHANDYEGNSPMAYYSSYSVDRIRDRRRNRGRLAITMLWALVLALFISVGSASADPELVPFCVNAGSANQHTVYANANANAGTPGVCAQLTYITCDENSTTPGQFIAPYTCVPATVTCDANSTSPGVHNKPYTCVAATVTCDANSTSPGVHNLPYTCVAATVTCDANSTSPGVHNLPYTCVAATVTCDANSTSPGVHNMPYTCVADEGDDDLCPGQSCDDHGQADCIAAHGTWNPQGDPKCASSSNDDEEEGGCEGQSCESHGKADCDAAHGSFSQGVCTVDVCIAGVKSSINLNDAAGLRRAVDGTCPADKCPDAFNPGYQEPESGACAVSTLVCRNGSTLTVASNAWISGDSAGACPVSLPDGAAGPGNAEVFSDPAVDVDKDNPVLSVGALAAPLDGGASAEVLGAQASAGGGAAAGGDEEDAVLAEGDSLPVTGMSPMGTVFAALFAVLFGAFAYGEAARVTRRRRKVSAAA
jgi:hypothetical protein